MKTLIRNIDIDDRKSCLAGVGRSNVPIFVETNDIEVLLSQQTLEKCNSYSSTGRGRQVRFPNSTRLVYMVDVTMSCPRLCRTTTTTRNTHISS